VSVVRGPTGADSKKLPGRISDPALLELPDMIRYLCGLFGHRKANWLLDESGEFVVRDCTRCGTVIFQSLFEGHDQEDYEALLDRWFIDWREQI